MKVQIRGYGRGTHQLNVITKDLGAVPRVGDYWRDGTFGTRLVGRVVWNEAGGEMIPIVCLSQDEEWT